MAARLAVEVREIEGLMGTVQRPPSVDLLAEAIVNGDTKLEGLVRASIEKYSALFTYSTERLTHEEERFNRADDKAFKLATAFVFLTGATAFFCKRITETVIPPREIGDYILIFCGFGTLVISFVGWFRAIHVMRLKGYESLPLDRKVLDFFDTQSLLNFYGRFSETALKAYESTRCATDAKMKKLDSAFFFAISAAGSLALLVCVFGWCLWKNPARFRSVSDSPKSSQPVQPERTVPNAPASAKPAAKVDPAFLPKPDNAINPPETTAIFASEAPLSREEEPLL